MTLPLQSAFFWMLRFDYTPLFCKVKDAVKQCDRLLNLTMRRVLQDKGTLRANAKSYSGYFDEEGWALLQKAEKNAKPTDEEMRELAHDMAIYMANSPAIHTFVTDYWALRVNMIQAHIYALKMHGQFSRGPDHVIIQQKLDRLDEKKGYAEAYYSNSCQLHKTVVKGEIKWNDSDEDESSLADYETMVPVVQKEKKVIVVLDKSSDSSEEVAKSDQSSESSDSDDESEPWNSDDCSCEDKEGYECEHHKDQRDERKTMEDRRLEDSKAAFMAVNGKERDDYLDTIRRARSCGDKSIGRILERFAYHTAVGTFDPGRKESIFPLGKSHDDIQADLAMATVIENSKKAAEKRDRSPVRT